MFPHCHAKTANKMKRYIYFENPPRSRYWVWVIHNSRATVFPIFLYSQPIRFSIHRYVCVIYYRHLIISSIKHQRKVETRFSPPACLPSQDQYLFEKYPFYLFCHFFVFFKKNGDNIWEAVEDEENNIIFLPLHQYIDGERIWIFWCDVVVQQ